MSHPEQERLALGALEGYPDDVRRHLEECAECAAEAESLRRVVEAGRRSADSPVALARPADRVWEHIAEELELPTAAAGAGAGGATAATAPASTPRRRRRTPTSWWRRPTAWVAAAALLLGIAGTVVVQQIVASNETTVLASAQLTPLPGWDAEGTAEVETQGDQRTLVVDLAADPGQDYLEVWLISTDLERLISLGVLTGSEGRFELPADVDLDDFAIVDVSAEPLDGDPAHSGDSVVRGELA